MLNNRDYWVSFKVTVMPHSVGAPWAVSWIGAKVIFAIKRQREMLRKIHSSLTHNNHTHTNHLWLLLHVCGDMKSRGRVAFSVIVPRLDCAKQHVFLLKWVSPDFEFADETLVSFLSHKYDLNSFVQLRQWIRTYKMSTNSSSRASRATQKAL